MDHLQDIEFVGGAFYRTAAPPMSSTNPSSLADDLDGLKRLISEKEKDLELAARIGQSLLSKNRLLQVNHDELAQLFTITQDELTQLRHELSMNKEILRIYSLESSDYGADNLDCDPAVVSFKHVQMLQARIRFLEDENNRLRQEAKELSVEAADFETKETEVLHGCVKELAETHGRIQTLTENLRHKTDENTGLREEIEVLLSEMVELQDRVKKASRENEEIKESLDVYKENQNQLATELMGLQDKYDLLSRHAHGLEDDLRDLRRKDTYIQSWAEVTSSFAHVDSLAAELDHSLYHVYNSVESAEEEHHEDAYRKVMDMVRLVNVQRGQAQTIPTAVNPSSACITSSGSPRPSSRKPSPSSLGQPDVSDTSLGSYFANADLQPRPSADSPRTSTSHDEGICDRSMSSYEQFRNCATPDSAMSLGAASDTSFHHRPGYADVTDRLQLVKPMQGSEILRKWQQLATPQINGFLDARPGIYTAGQNAEADQIATEQVAARKEKGPSLDYPAATLSIPTPPKFTFAGSGKGRVSDPSSIFSISSLKLGRQPSVVPVFPRPFEPASSPGMNLAKLLNSGVPAAVEGVQLNSCDPLADLPNENADPARPRSRHTSGSLSSASRSPSPVHVPDTESRTPAAGLLFHQPFQKLNQRSSLMTPSQSLQRLAKKSSPVLRDSRRPVKKPVV
ncbi:putative Trafficking kinesin-binding protein 1 [Hypsibius exemplaris]|uniref:Trafficking kinesin-binding protein 1 n=1 Tax=Hypsibius exemplaris TaxID=2072580 RepID=A0A1W0WAM7_HYPEX|nr:putative Trafficking kinesin-binding protein 1 [Hypsibius exemplaris]